MSDVIFVLNKGKIEQSGTPTDIYDEPINRFVADFIGESNIVEGLMIEDFWSNLSANSLSVWTKAFDQNEPVDIVIRPGRFRDYLCGEWQSCKCGLIPSYSAGFIMKFAV